jgi:predicted DCC family thiol-disulfide oxidoreductase YuxK
MSPPKTIVFYDNGCSMCVGVTGWLYKIDHHQEFELVPYQDSKYLEKYPQLSTEQLAKQIHVVKKDGRIVKGADAMMEIWRRTGHWSAFMGSVFKFPPFIWLARPLYNLVAKYRRDLFPNRF